MVLKNKRILVLGMGISGNSSLLFLQSMGAICDIYDTNPNAKIDNKCKNKINKLFFADRLPNFGDERYDLIVKSPGVPPNLDILMKARELKIDVIGDIELAYSFIRGKIIGITGTNGKSTTTTWVHDVFIRAGKKAHLAGNIGVPLCSVIMESNSEDDIFVCELSSFQLNEIHDFKPCIASILNITPDHLNWHGSMENYIRAKFNIAKNMDDDCTLILNYDDPILAKFSNEVGKDDELNCKLKFFSKYDNKAEFNALGNFNKPALIGEHNLENALAVYAICKTYGIEEKYILDSLAHFAGITHRNEFLGTKRGVLFYNDSKATNPEASIPALKSIKNPTILIAGGMNKNSEYTRWINHFDNVKFVLLFGETKYDIAKNLEIKNIKNYEVLDTLDEAFESACRIAEPDDAVLLSPACASWDMYKNFEVRGNHFKKLFSEW